MVLFRFDMITFNLDVLQGTSWFFGFVAMIASAFLWRFLRSLF